MHSFLDSVAQDLFKRFCVKDGITDNKALTGVTVVFPNRRASGFFNTSLLQCSSNPFFAPNYSTIQDLFNSLSELQQLDDIQLVCRLYQEYCKYLGTKESLDSFWPWGEILLSDFDGIDSQMVPAQALFSTLNTVKEQTSDMSYLTQEQVEVLERFFRSFNAQNVVKENSEIKRNFVSVWNRLFEIYSSFTDTLQKAGVGYAGMIQRLVAQSLKENSLSEQKLDMLNRSMYVFVGFNRLQQSEKVLFDYLKQNGKALFYWDYSDYFSGKTNIEAGSFIKENMARYPAPKGFECNTRIPDINVISAKTGYAQASYIQTWLNEKGFDSESEQTDHAVVLCNSGLLMHVIHSLNPELMSNTNITMGYPLVQTSGYTLVKTLLDLQNYYSVKNNSFRLKYVAEVLSVPFVTEKVPQAVDLRNKLLTDRIFYPSIEQLNAYCSDENLSLLNSLWKKTESAKEQLEWIMNTIALFAPGNNALDSESVYRIYTIINRLCSLLDTDLKELKQSSVVKLLERMLFTATVPFHGDPIHGLQIMGMLETRNLDFKNVLILGANDDVLPGFSESPSFIPFSLRKAFGMNTFLDSNAIAAYNFYHLLLRSESVTVMYNSNTEGVSSGQPSRFLHQLLVEWPGAVKHFQIESQITPQSRPHYSSVERSSEISNQLIDRFGKNGISPSAVKTYLKCSMKFYFQYVLGIKESTDLDSNVNPMLLGSVYHKSMELIYDSFCKKDDKSGKKFYGIINKNMLQAVLKNASAIDNFIDQAFKIEYFKNGNVVYNGTLMIEKTKVRRYVRNQLLLDCEYAPFEYIASEMPLYLDLEIKHPLNADELLKIKVGGIIDRIDLKDGIIRIVDYKTGKAGKLILPESVEKLIEQASKNSTDKIENQLQVMIYAWILDQKNIFPDYKLAAILFYPLKHAVDEQLLQEKSGTMQDVRDYVKPFETALLDIVSEIYSAQARPFAACDNERKCEYCSYKALCNR